MPFDDLNLEFEDEEEAAKKKKAESLAVDVDLEFQGPDPGAKPRAVARPEPQGSAPAARPAPPARPPQQQGEVRNINEARPATAQPVAGAPARPANAAAPRPVSSTAPQATARPQPQVSGANALDMNYDLDSENIVQMREEMRRIQIESEIKVGIAEFKTEYLSEMLSDMKLLEHQIGQLLVRINAKHPESKQEVLMIKKILADFNAKKRK